MKTNILRTRLTTIVIALITCTLSLTLHAQDTGRDGGGGDPEDIRSIKLLDSSQAAATIKQAHAQQVAAAHDAEVAEQKKQALRRMDNLIVSVEAGYSTLLSMNYPFEFPGAAPQLGLVVSTLKGVVSSGKITVNNSLVIDGKPAMFFSKESDKSMQVNLARINSLSISECAGKEYLCSNAFWSRIVSTMFHEALVLNGIEESRSYPFTEKFKVAFDALLNPELRYIFAQKAWSANPAIGQAVRNFKSENYLSRITFSIAALNEKTDVLTESRNRSNGSNDSDFNFELGLLSRRRMMLSDWRMACVKDQDCGD